MLEVIPWSVRDIFLFLESCITEIKMEAIFIILMSNMFNKVPSFLCYRHNTMDFLNTVSKIWISLTTNQRSFGEKVVNSQNLFGPKLGEEAIKVFICNVIKE